MRKEKHTRFNFLANPPHIDSFIPISAFKHKVLRRCILGAVVALGVVCVFYTAKTFLLIPY